jgi:hypothetical protein
MFQLLSIFGCNYRMVKFVHDLFGPGFVGLYNRVIIGETNRV